MVMVKSKWMSHLCGFPLTLLLEQLNIRRLRSDLCRKPEIVWFFFLLIFEWTACKISDLFREVLLPSPPPWKALVTVATKTLEEKLVVLCNFNTLHTFTVSCGFIFTWCLRVSVNRTSKPLTKHWTENDEFLRKQSLDDNFWSHPYGRRLLQQINMNQQKINYNLVNMFSNIMPHAENITSFNITWGCG